MLVLVALVVALDQASKNYVFDLLLVDRPEVVVLPLFSLVPRLNTGISFSFLSHLPSAVFATLAGIIAVGMLAWLAQTTRRLPAIGLGLVIGGALGNLIDRVRLGAVRDFLLVHWPDPWPDPGATPYLAWIPTNLAFNLADAAISGGVVLLIWDGMFGPHRVPKSP